jgi:hypothetical protein
MNKRDRFVADLRKEAKARGLAFRIAEHRGNGGHVIVYVGDRFTVIGSRPVDPKTARKIRRALDLE